MRRVRFTIRWMMAGVGILAVLLSVAIPVGRERYLWRRRLDLWHRLDATLRVVRASCPRSVSPDVWEESVGWINIIGSDIYSNDAIPFDSKERHVDALRERLQGPVGPELISWIWDGYAALMRGNSSEGFVRSYRCHAIAPLLRDALVVRPKGITPDAWDRAARETGAAIDAVIGNFGGTASTAEEQDRFLGSVAAILARPAGSEKLLAVWKEIAASGPLGKSYVEGRLASIREDLDSVRDGR